MVYNPCPRKTTVIVNKIFGIERAWMTSGSVGPRPRQIYITKSPLLTEKVEEDYVGLWFSLGTGPDIPEHVTEHIQRWNSRKKINLFVADSAVGDRDDLPKRYSELQDEHFPLFITTDEVSTTISESEKKNLSLLCSSYLQLCTLLEADMEPDDSSEDRKLKSPRKEQKTRERRVVTLDVFKREYWPHLHQGLTKGVSASYCYRLNLQPWPNVLLEHPRWLIATS
jgi:hypothetical protein